MNTVWRTRSASMPDTIVPFCGTTHKRPSSARRANASCTGVRLAPSASAAAASLILSPGTRTKFRIFFFSVRYAIHARSPRCRFFQSAAFSFPQHTLSGREKQRASACGHARNGRFPQSFSRIFYKFTNNLSVYLYVSTSYKKYQYEKCLLGFLHKTSEKKGCFSQGNMIFYS